jgi:hypothetical protein
VGRVDSLATPGVLDIEHAAKLARNGICTLVAMKAARVGAIIRIFVLFPVCNRDAIAVRTLGVRYSRVPILFRGHGAHGSDGLGAI